MKGRLVEALVEFVVGLLAYGLTLLILWGVCRLFGWDPVAVLPYYTLYLLIDHKISKYAHGLRP